MENFSDLKILKEKVRAKEYINKEFFNIVNNIKYPHSIDPLFYHIFKLALNKYNKIAECSDINMVRFSEFPGITDKEKKRNQIDFGSNDAYVLYVSYNEHLIKKFDLNKKLLPDSLDINNFDNIDEKEIDLNQIDSDNLSEKFNKSDSFSDNEDNKEDLNLDSELNFEIHCLSFLFKGIKKLIYLPRIVFYPISKSIDMEKIDSAFIIKELISESKDYFKNFEAINLNLKNSLSKKEIKICNNDLIFVEISFILPTQERLDDFLNKIIKFIKLYKNANIIDIQKYTIRPIIIIDNDYELKKEEYNCLVNKIKEFYELNKAELEIKIEDIINNIQLCYIWPNITILNPFLTANDLDNQISSQQNRLSLQQEQLAYQQKQLNCLKKQIITLLILSISICIFDIITIFKTKKF